MYECTFPFWPASICVAICFALVSGYINIYIPSSKLPTPESAKQHAANGYLEIFAAERFNPRLVAGIFVGLSALAATLFLWRYFSLHPVTTNILSILGRIGIVAAIIFVALLFLASLSLLFCIAVSIHIEIFAKRFSKLYGIDNINVIILSHE